MTKPRVCSLVLNAALLVALAMTASAQDRRLTHEARDLARTRPVDRTHSDGFTPLRGTGGGLLGSDDRRVGTPLPGVAWTPGLPGGGGGSGGGGGDQEFHGQNSGYTVEVLPLLYPDERVTALDIAEGGEWVSGLTSTSVGLSCQQPVLWKRETGGWSGRTLPGLTEEYGGYAFAVTQSGMVVGRLQSPCTPGEPFIPVAWTELADGTWAAEALPSPHEGPTEGQAIDVASVPTVGHVVVGWTVTAAGAPRATVWYRSPDAWVAVDLGVVAEFSEAQSINERGVVVGWTDDSLLPGQFVRPFEIVPVDVDHDGRLDWFRDSDGDLMHSVTEGLPAGSHYPDVNESREAIGWRSEALAPLVSVLQTGVAASETPLDTRDFVDTHARGISDSGQIIGEGGVATRDGTDTRGLLWERQEDGVWLLHDLNDLVALPHRDDRIGTARRVNDCGDIIADAVVNRQSSAVVLVPEWSPCNVD